MIELLLNQNVIQVDNLAPNLSTLDWLRGQLSLKGTKEGCASGDCGACTVVVGELINNKLIYKSMNACLLLVGNLHNKHLITVDALTTSKKLTDQSLHPVQRALSDCHGTQCGFCTPGFVMSMYVLYLNHDRYPGDGAAITALGGNLCRCTGYRPILEACNKMFEYPQQTDKFKAASEAFLHAQAQHPLRSLTTVSSILHQQV